MKMSKTLRSSAVVLIASVLLIFLWTSGSEMNTYASGSSSGLADNGLVYPLEKTADDTVSALKTMSDGKTALDILSAEDPDLNYLILVNGSHPMPEGYLDKGDIISSVNSRGNSFRAERAAYMAYLKLKNDLEENDHIHIDVDFGLRDEKEQQAVIDDLTETYGAAYAYRTAARPGYSEHHTGLALDIYLIIDGRNVYLNHEMEQYPEIWEKIHGKLSKYGFILRYPKSTPKRSTGYSYEPWHIRYTGTEAAAEIMSKPAYTLEMYLRGR